jgi:hypothetical protein
LRSGCFRGSDLGEERHREIGFLQFRNLGGHRQRKEKQKGGATEEEHERKRMRLGFSGR